MSATGEKMIRTRPSGPPVQHRGRAALHFGRDQHDRTGVWARCDVCGAEEGVTLPPQSPPLAIDQQFAQKRGWKILGHGDSATCPSCQEKKKMAKPQSQTPTPDQAKAQRQVFALLEAHLRVDGTLGEYDPGWSDARIAEDTKLSVDFVTATRRSAFAPRLRDALAEELLNELKAAEQQLEVSRRELRELVETTLDGYKDQIRALRDRLAAHGTGA